MVLASARISAVNFSEVIAKLLDYGLPLGEVVSRLKRLQLDVIPFTAADACGAAALRLPSSAGLSLGDRCRLALGRRLDAPVLTTEPLWKTLGLAVPVELIR